MKHKRILALFLLTVLFLCLTGCKKDPVAAEREAMEEQYDVNGADLYHIGRIMVPPQSFCNSVL